MDDNLLRDLVLGTFKNGAEPFRPFVIFDDALDYILVQVRDCSVLEERIGMILIALKDNYLVNDGQENIGFIIENARGLCSRHSLPPQGEIRLASLLDALMSEFPNDTRVTAYVENVARPMLNEFSLDSVIL